MYWSAITEVVMTPTWRSKRTLFSFSQKCLRETDEKIGISSWKFLIVDAFRFLCTGYTNLNPWHTGTSERIAWFIEGQAFLRSYDSAPKPISSPLSHQQVASLSQSSCVSPVQLTDGRGGGGGRGADSYDLKKAWPSVSCSILSGIQYIEANVNKFSTLQSRKCGKWDCRLCWGWKLSAGCYSACQLP